MLLLVRVLGCALDYRHINCTFASSFEKNMNYQKLNSTSFEAAESIESKYWVNHVDSGLSRWLIEAAFVCYLLQAAINWSPTMHWMEEMNLSWIRAIIQTFGSLVMYVGLLRGMRPLYRPFTVAWWIVIALNVAGCVTEMVPAIMYTVGLPVAISLMLVYLPFGCLIAFSYRGRLRQVGIWMALYILISSIIPVLSFLLFGPESGMANLPLEIPCIGVIIIYAWVQRRVLVTGGIAEG